MSLNIRDVYYFLRQTLNIKALSDMTVYGQFDIKSSHKFIIDYSSYRFVTYLYRIPSSKQFSHSN